MSTEYGRRLKAARAHAQMTQKQLAQQAGMSQSNLSELETIAHGSAMTTALATVCGVDAHWLATGEGTMLTTLKATEPPARWTGVQHSSRGHPLQGMAQDLSQPLIQAAPQFIPWEQLLMPTLPAEFQTAVPDGAMEPEVPRGAIVICITGVAHEPGDWALLADGDGHLYLRELRQLTPGQWEAHARNPAYLPLSFEREGLRVLAVFDGVRGRKVRR